MIMNFDGTKNPKCRIKRVFLFRMCCLCFHADLAYMKVNMSEVDRMEILLSQGVILFLSLRNDGMQAQ